MHRRRGCHPSSGCTARMMLPLIAYALLGPSRTWSWGPIRPSSPIIAASIVPLAAGDTQRAVEVALVAVLAVLVGSVGSSRPALPASAS